MAWWLTITALTILLQCHRGLAQTSNETEPDVCDEFGQCCYPSCACNKCWQHDSVCQVDVPAYGEGTTMISGQKSCPGFAKDSSVCQSDTCYFWTKVLTPLKHASQVVVQVSGGKSYNCAAAGCDLLIIDHCTGLGYVHPSLQNAKMPTLTKLDLGCAVLVRVGIAPFSDWGQERSVGHTTATVAAWPATYLIRPGLGDTSGLPLG